MVWGCGATEGAAQVARRQALRLDASDAIQRPLGFVAQCGIVCSLSRRLRAACPFGPMLPALRPRRCAHRGIRPSALRSTAAQRIARRGRCLRGPHTPPIGRRESDRPRLGEISLAAPAFGPMDARTPPRKCGRRGLVRESRDESAHRRTFFRAKRAQGTCGIARNVRILCLSARLNAGRIDSVWGVRSIRTSTALRRMETARHEAGPPAAACRGLIRRMIQTFFSCRSSSSISSQQRQRTPCPLDQGGFGGCPDLRVLDREPIRPVRRGARGKIRILGLAPLRE